MKMLCTIFITISFPIILAFKKIKFNIVENSASI